MPEVKPKTAFTTTSGKSYQNMALFSICLLLGVFCSLMLQTLSGLDLCFAYLDYILMYSMSWKEYLQHLEMVFKYLKEANLRISLANVNSLKRHPHYLGHLISEQGIQSLPEKVTAIEKLKEPSNIHDLVISLV